MIVLKVKNKNDIFSKTIGLICKKNPENIYFKTRFGIHTFGMNFPIDILILDSHNIVKKIKKSLKPTSIFFWNPQYNTVLELKEKTIENMNICLGDTIDLREVH